MTRVILSGRLRPSGRDGSTIVICPPWRRISRFGKPLTFGPFVFPVLVCLLAIPGRIVGSDDLLEAMYGDDSLGGPMTAEKCLHIAIMRARKRLSPIGIDIINYHGRGYSAELNAATERAVA